MPVVSRDNLRPQNIQFMQLGLEKGFLGPEGSGIRNADGSQNSGRIGDMLMYDFRQWVGSLVSVCQFINAPDNVIGQRCGVHMICPATLCHTHQHQR